VSRARFVFHKNIFFFCLIFSKLKNELGNYHGRTGRTELGGRKEICQTFRFVPALSKKNLPEKLSEIVIDGGGGGGRGITKNSYWIAYFPQN
jgi:hypothetical protein